MKHEELISAVEALRPWYHKIDLGDGVITPGKPYDGVWQNILAIMGTVDYSGKRVLDTAAFDGFWSFEAEKRGASLVIATDCNWIAFPNFLFCREVMGSKVVPFYNVPMHDLVNRLDAYMVGKNSQYDAVQRIDDGDPRFDVVHHLGLLYHLRDPLQSLLQCRSVMKDGATLLIETGYYTRSDESVMLFNAVGSDERVYPDETTWWAPTLRCLMEMLACSLFKPSAAMSTVGENERVGRVCLTATAVPVAESNPRLLGELRNTYRTPGLNLLWTS